MLSDIAETRIILICSSILGSLISFRFLKMNWKQRMTAALSAMGMSYLLGPSLSLWLNLQAEFAGCLVGMFGMAICDALFRGINNSDLSFKFSDIIGLFRKG